MMIADAGIGSPLKYSLSYPTSCELNLASRSAPKMSGIELRRMPIPSYSWNWSLYTMNEGAAPKETTSERESNSTPKSLDDFVMRAMSPSKTSKIPAMRMNHDAMMKSPDELWTIELKPQKIF